MQEIIEKNISDLADNDRKWKHELGIKEAKIKELQEREDEMDAWSKEKTAHENEVANLKHDFGELQKKMNEEITAREREKIKATESLRKEMLHKIKETKANLLALNDDQLQTTTRLTILQNS